LRFETYTTAQIPPDGIRLHLNQFKKDNDAKYRLILINSRLHRLVRYYKEKNILPGNWKPAVNLY